MHSCGPMRFGGMRCSPIQVYSGPDADTGGGFMAAVNGTRFSLRSLPLAGLERADSGGLLAPGVKGSASCQVGDGERDVEHVETSTDILCKRSPLSRSRRSSRGGCCPCACAECIRLQCLCIKAKTPSAMKWQRERECGSTPVRCHRCNAHVCHRAHAAAGVLQRQHLLAGCCQLPVTDAATDSEMSQSDLQMIWQLIDHERGFCLSRLQLLAATAAACLRSALLAFAQEPDHLRSVR